jgi:N-acetylmuramoyl-L-alanine amidase
MTIIDHPSPNHSPRKVGVRVDTVLIHHTGGGGDVAALRWLRNGGSGVSAHYVIGVKGDVWRLVPEHLKAWHAGKGRLPWETCPVYDFNHRSIGIEVVNPGDGVTPFTEAQYRALEWLVPDIVRRHRAVAVCAAGWRHPEPLKVDTLGQRGWPGSLGEMCVLGHRDVAPGRKTDPADNFDWGRIRASLAGNVA